MHHHHLRRSNTCNCGNEIFPPYGPIEDYGAGTIRLRRPGPCVFCPNSSRNMRREMPIVRFAQATRNKFKETNDKITEKMRELPNSVKKLADKVREELSVLPNTMKSAVTGAFCSEFDDRKGSRSRVKSKLNLQHDDDRGDLNYDFNEIIDEIGLSKNLDWNSAILQVPIKLNSNDNQISLELNNAKKKNSKIIFRRSSKHRDVDESNNSNLSDEDSLSIDNMYKETQKKKRKEIYSNETKKESTGKVQYIDNNKESELNNYATDQERVMEEKLPVRNSTKNNIYIPSRLSRNSNAAEQINERYSEVSINPNKKENRTQICYVTPLDNNYCNSVIQNNTNIKSRHSLNNNGSNNNGVPFNNSNVNLRSRNISTIPVDKYHTSFSNRPSIVNLKDSFYDDDTSYRASKLDNHNNNYYNHYDKYNSADKPTLSRLSRNKEFTKDYTDTSANANLRLNSLGKRHQTRPSSAYNQKLFDGKQNTNDSKNNLSVNQNYDNKMLPNQSSVPTMTLYPIGQRYKVLFTTNKKLVCNHMYQQKWKMKHNDGTVTDIYQLPPNAATAYINESIFKQPIGQQCQK